MDTQILKQILNISFYENNKSKLSHTLFHDEPLELYDIIVESHTKWGSDLSPDELYALWLDKNPTATHTNKDSMKQIVGQIDSQDLMTTHVAETILEGMWKRDVGNRIANLATSMIEGNTEAFSKLLKLIDKHQNGFSPTDFPDETTNDLDIILAELSDDKRFRTNIPVLSRQLYGIGRGEFGLIFARPNTGKTALGISLCCGPNGYAEQGANVCILGNEEDTKRTMLRAYHAWTGMTKEEVVNAPKLARDRFEQIKDKVTVMNISGWPIGEVEAYLKYKEADVGIVDMLDKVTVAGNYDAPHLRLREVYTQAREIPKRLNCALWGLSQASNDGEGKTILTPDMMEGSKTGKYAEADLILGVGKYPDEADGSENFLRFITVGKNKINGWHGTVTAKIERMISRYVD